MRTTNSRANILVHRLWYGQIKDPILLEQLSFHVPLMKTRAREAKTFQSVNICSPVQAMQDKMNNNDCDLDLSLSS